MTGSLKTRLLLGGAGFITIALLIAALGLSLLFERHVKSWIDAELNTYLDQLIAGVDRTPSGALAVVRPPTDPRFDTPLSGLYWQVALQAGDVQRSRSLWDFVIPLPHDAGIDGLSHHHAVAGPNRQALYLIDRNVQLPGRLGGVTARFAVGRDEAEVTSAQWRFARALLPLLSLLGALLIGAAWLQVSIGLKPLASVRNRIADIRSGRRSRLGAEFPAEVQPLAREIDTLLDARDRQLEIARQRAADLAHGLKTPLQVLSGGVAKLKAKGEDDLAADISHAAHAMQRHVDRQLARARMQSGNTAASADVADVIRRVVRVLELTPDGAAKSWGTDIAPGTRARIHDDDLAEALGGIAENAARFARSRIVIGAKRAGDNVVISIGDDGPGIPEAKHADVLKRGERLDTSESGSGLGLAIATDIMEAWGGTLNLSASDGLFRVGLELPAAASD